MLIMKFLVDTKRKPIGHLWKKNVKFRANRSKIISIIHPWAK